MKLQNALKFIAIPSSRQKQHIRC